MLSCSPAALCCSCSCSCLLFLSPVSLLLLSWTTQPSTAAFCRQCVHACCCSAAAAAADGRRPELALAPRRAGGGSAAPSCAHHHPVFHPFRGTSSVPKATTAMCAISAVCPAPCKRRSDRLALITTAVRVAADCAGHESSTVLLERFKRCNSRVSEALSQLAAPAVAAAGAAPVTPAAAGAAPVSPAQTPAEATTIQQVITGPGEEMGLMRR
jgi:hypothetical protein